MNKIMNKINIDYWDNNDNHDNDNNIYEHNKYNNYNNTNEYIYEDNTFTLIILFIVMIWGSIGFCRFIKYCQYHSHNNQRLITNNNQSEINIEDIEKTLIKYNNEEHTEKTCSICLDEYLNND